MKKCLLFAMMFLSGTILYSQAHTAGTISAQLGVDAAGHGTIYENKYNGTVLDTDSSAAVTVMYPISVHYSLFNWFSLGFVFQTGSYLEDPDNAEANGNKARFIDLDAKFYPVNKDKFTWYVGLRYGFSHLELNRYIVGFAGNIPLQYLFRGKNFGAYTGFNWYFAKNIGMHVNLGYTSNNFLLYEYSLNNSVQDISNFDNHLWTKGANLSLGLSFRFGGK